MKSRYRRTASGPTGGPARPVSADLHVHTSHSDGSCSPGEVVHAARSLGLVALAITDHDTLSALPVARPIADRVGIELVGGVELSAEFDGREVHILGHFVRDDDPALLDALDVLKAARARRIVAMVEKLNGLGFRVDLPVLVKTFPRATLGRRHLADWLVRTGQVAGHREVFACYLGDGGPAEVAKVRLDAVEAIRLIRGAGGVAGLAHPPFDLRLEQLGRLVAAGLGAIEVAGPAINAAKGRRWRDWAGELDLVPVAGSDFHAPDRPGRWLGSTTTPEADLDRLRARGGPAAP